MTNPVVIRCVCPGAPHESDTVTLRDPLDFRTAITLRQSVAALYVGPSGETQQPTVAEVTGLLIESYLLYTIASWTLVDERGKPVPVSRENVIGLLMHDNPIEAAAIGDAANELYMDKVVLPLLLAASGSSRPTPTKRSTSRTNGSPRGTAKRSSPSSITSIPTVGTARTSRPHATDSSSSRRSA